MKIKFDGETYEIEELINGSYLPILQLDDGTEWYIAKDYDEAGKAARKYWEDIIRNDPEEFRCIIGEERLLKWALNESDEFGIHNLDKFLERVEDYPEETFATYDGNLIEGIEDIDDELADELEIDKKELYAVILMRHN